MVFCQGLGFTIKNTPGVDQIKPKAMGMKGHEINFETILKGDGQSEIRVKDRSRRVDLSGIPEQSEAEYITSRSDIPLEDPEEFIQLDVGRGEDYEKLNYNHKVRRKLRRAIEHAETEKELLIRQRTLDSLQGQGLNAPESLKTKVKPVSVRGIRVLDNGRLETAKQERIRARIELADFNDRMRILRKQAKEAAIYAGLRKYAEATGMIPQEAGNACKMFQRKGEALSPTPAQHAFSISQTRTQTRADGLHNMGSEEYAGLAWETDSMSSESLDTHIT